MVASESDHKPLAMIVDDDLSLRLTMGAALKKAGFAVVNAEDGEKALTLFQRNNPDLILLDVMMPGLDGFETCRRLRKLPGGEYCQVLMVTGLDDTESTEMAFQAGANDFISKPINWVMLGHRARYMLRTSEMVKELVRSQSRLQKNQALARQGGWQVDYSEKRGVFEGHFSISPEACQILGFSDPAPTITYEAFFAPISTDEQKDVRREIDRALQDQQAFSLHYQINHPDGSTRYILNQGEFLPNERGVPDLMMGIVQDVTKMKQAEAEIHQLAYYDDLTGLANRILFQNRLDHLIPLAKRNNTRFALLVLDLDHFKLINDTLEHQAGDMLLKIIAAKTKEVVRNMDTISREIEKGESLALTGAEISGNTVARLGGDEFLVLLTDIENPGHAAYIARRLLEEIQKPCLINEKEVSVTASIGISLFPDDGEKADTLLKHADAAMYHAKDRGRNNYQFFMESLNTLSMERFVLEQDLKKALEKEEFKLYYQPQISLLDRQIVGAEALIRWQHPEKGMIPPDRFIPVAEESGMIMDINRWVIRTACEQSRAWQDQDLPYIRIAVNLSGYRLGEQNIIEILQGALEGNGLTGDRLEIEVTENILMQDTSSIITTFKAMKDLGVKVALDDFGTGYSSLSYLTSFDVDIIKIDRSFVMDCTKNEKNRVIIKAIIALGHSLNMGIVAEGIETLEDFKLLRSYGCDDCQGFFFSPPVPAAQFAEMLKKKVM